MVGREVTVEEVMSEIRKDSHYYEMSSGGVTLSGGECLLQSEFAAALLEKCKEERRIKERDKNHQWWRARVEQQNIKRIIEK